MTIENWMERLTRDEEPQDSSGRSDLAAGNGLAVDADPELALRPPRPWPAVGSRDYAAAMLGRKMWIAANGHRIEGAVDLQRSLLAMVRTPGFDPWVAAEILRQIEAHVAGREFVAAWSSALGGGL